MNGTVHVIDDDAANRASLRASLEALRFAAKEYESAEDYLAAPQEETPSCVLTDLRLRGMSGLELLESIAQRGQTTPVVLITAFAKTALTVRAIRNGAVNVLDKPVDEDHLWEAIHEALKLDQERRMSRQEADTIEARFRELTPQESQVLDMLIGGMTNREIASALDVSTRTVEARRHNIFRKTKTESVPDLVKLTLAFQQIA